MTRRAPSLRDAAAPFLLGLGAAAGTLVVPAVVGPGTPLAWTLGGVTFAAATIAAGWLTRDVIQGYVALLAGVAVAPALATALDPASRDDPWAPLSVALLFGVLAGPGFIGGVIASGIAGRRGRR